MQKNQHMYLPWFFFAINMWRCP